MQISGRLRTRARARGLAGNSGGRRLISSRYSMIAIDECGHQTLWIDIELGRLEVLLTVRIHEDRLIGNAF